MSIIAPKSQNVLKIIPCIDNYRVNRSIFTALKGDNTRKKAKLKSKMY